MFFITGRRPVSVMALMDNLDVELDVIDAIIARMDNRALATLGSTGNLPVSDPGKLVMHVNCDRCWLDIDFITGAGRIRHADGTDEILPAFDAEERPAGCEQPENFYPLQAPAWNLADVITGKTSNGSSGEFAWRTIELLDAAYRSAAVNDPAICVDSLYS